MDRPANDTTSAARTVHEVYLIDPATKLPMTPAGGSGGSTTLGAGTAEVGKVGMEQQLVTDCLIASGASLSAGIDLGTARLCGLSIPAAWTAANITFQASYDGTTYNDVYDASGIEKVIIIGGASRRVILSPADFLGIRYVKVRSGTTGTPVNQGADRTLKLITQP